MLINDIFGQKRCLVHDLIIGNVRYFTENKPINTNNKSGCNTNTKSYLMLVDKV